MIGDRIYCAANQVLPIRLIKVFRFLLKVSLFYHLVILQDRQFLLYLSSFEGPLEGTAGH